MRRPALPRWGPGRTGLNAGEAGHARQEDALTAEDVAEATAGDEADGVGQSVAGNHQLHLGGRGMQIGLHGWQGQVDDEEVERAEEGRRQQDGQSRPAPRSGGRRHGGRGKGVRGGKGSRPDGAGSSPRHLIVSPVFPMRLRCRHQQISIHTLPQLASGTGPVVPALRAALGPPTAEPRWHLRGGCRNL